MPRAAKSAHHQTRSKAPIRMVNSPMKPLSAGRPIDDMVMIRKTVAKTGITAEMPPYSRDQAGVPLLIDDADEPGRARRTTGRDDHS